MSIVASVLKHAAGPGFRHFAERHNLPWESAAEYRQRHITDALAMTLKALLGKM